ncbi:hypothetical protein [Noviherbaspirillum sp.]|uniref:hypothetical protein n=1 Tax=Noviherbaspirillum sp. TaxID=1926288 RepID=UPI002D71612E|nr:hypothetical protein [Noviherbaspirillum sp.]HZW20993.1 hypothetical protein [Noviherbaspirillum sp.]
MANRQPMLVILLSSFPVGNEDFSAECVADMPQLRLRVASLFILMQRRAEPCYRV